MTDTANLGITLLEVAQAEKEVAINEGFQIIDDAFGDIAPSGAGTKNGATVTVEELGDAVLHKTILTLTATPIVLTDDPGVGQWGTVKLYDFPAGDILVLGAVIDADLTLTEAAWLDNAQGDVGLGLTPVTNGGAIVSTNQCMINSTPIAAMTAQVGPINSQATATWHASVAGTADADCVLNIRIDDDVAHASGNGTITGTVKVTWINLGDF